MLLVELGSYTSICGSNEIPFIRAIDAQILVIRGHLSSLIEYVHAIDLTDPSRLLK